MVVRPNLKLIADLSRRIIMSPCIGCGNQCDQIWRNIATFMNLCQMVEGLISVWQTF